MKKNLPENGQIIVILAVAIVALFGFAALAIDVGMVYSDRRYDQSVADSAALAGAQSVQAGLEANNVSDSSGTMCSNAQLSNIIDTAKNKAVASMNRNDFLDATELSDGHGTVDISCVTINGSSHVIQVTTQIMSQTKTSFVHFFGGGIMVNSVKAVAWVYGSHNVGSGNSLAAFKPTCDKNKPEIYFKGGFDDIVIYDGGIFSNGCLKSNGSTEVNVYTTNPAAVAPGGAVQYTLGSWDPAGNGTINPSPQKSTGPLPFPKVPVPNCGTWPATLTNVKVTNGKTETLSPGWYGSLSNGGTLNLASGSYCFEGNFSLGAGGITKGPFPYPGSASEGVTIYMHQGTVDINGGATVYLKAALEAPTTPATSKALKGYLIITGNDNACNDTDLYDDTAPNQPCIKIIGGSVQDYTGTIIAPYGPIEFGGNSGTYGCENYMQILGWTLNLHGTTTMCLKYDPSKFGDTPSSLSMAE